MGRVHQRPPDSGPVHLAPNALDRVYGDWPVVASPEGYVGVQYGDRRLEVQIYATHGSNGV